MASNPSLICSPTSSQYTFAYSLVWSNNCKVAELLSDIPFISVGILAFGVSVLFFVFQRVSLSAIWLYFSALLAFVAVMLDLGQTIANEMGVGVTSSTAWQLIRAREILLALSIGFRFLFYWSYAAEPPRNALPSESTPPTRISGNFLILNSSDEPHGATWIRWGRPGRLLRIALLAAIAVIIALQIIWRVVPQFHRYSNVYAADAALELLVSSFLVLKLLLNTITPNSPDGVPVHTLGECLIPFCGLLMNIAIGVGNLLCFAFTESTVGRLLQSVEAYIIVVFVVVIALLRHRNLLSTAFPKRLKHRASNFRLPDPPRGSIFRVTPPLVETPRMSMIAGTTSNNVSTEETLRRSARYSLSRVSSWAAGKVPRNRSDDDSEKVKLWKQSDAEEGKVDPPYTGKLVDTKLRASLMSLTDEPKEWVELVHDADASHMSIMAALDAQSAIARSMEGSSSISQIIFAPQADVTRRTAPRQIRLKTTPPASIVSPNTLVVKDTGVGTVPEVEESPIHALDGIRSVGDASNDSQTSLDELLRQQNELEQSIEALKLFSARASSSVRSPESAELSRLSSSTSRRTASDVSLSNFPVPPWMTNPIPSLPASLSASMLRTRGDRHFHIAATPALQSAVSEAPSSLPVISPTPVDIPSTPISDGVPYSPLGDDSESLSAAAGRSPRFDSGGTQYNVTSFIGGLALPCESAAESTGKPSSTQTESNVSATQNSPSLEVNLQRTQLMPPPPLETMPAPPAQARFSLHAGYAGPLQGQSAANEPALFLQRRINQQIIPSLTITPSPSRSRLHIVTAPMEDDMLRLPTKPRTTREISSDSGGAEGTSDRPRKVFGRPRPPPLVIQSCSDYRPRAPPAQDAGG